ASSFHLTGPEGPRGTRTGSAGRGRQGTGVRLERMVTAASGQEDCADGRGGPRTRGDEQRGARVVDAVVVPVPPGDAATDLPDQDGARGVVPRVGAPVDDEVVLAEQDPAVRRAGPQPRAPAHVRCELLDALPDLLAQAVGQEGGRYATPHRAHDAARRRRVVVAG